MSKFDTRYITNGTSALKVNDRVDAAESSFVAFPGMNYDRVCVSGKAARHASIHSVAIREERAPFTLESLRGVSFNQLTKWEAALAFVAINAISLFIILAGA